ncbi:MAG: DUF3089 domain-containing protein [Hydrogenoanaerobacterium sp.]
MMEQMKKVFTLLLAAIILIVSLSGCTTNGATDYSVAENWAVLPVEAPRSADVFLICPTVDMGTETRYNMSLKDEATKASFLGALNMETGIYEKTCHIFAPYYRQITLSAYGQKNQSKYLELAYQDVKAAFLHYFDTYNQGRPFLLAGFSQGSQMGLMLMEDLFDEPKYAERLIAAYLIGWPVFDETLASGPHIKMATGETDIGCIISFNSESVETTASFVVPAGKKALAINPLNWKTDATPANASENLGACFTDYFGGIKKEIPHLTGAYLDPQRGTLKVLDVTPKDYPPGLPIFSSGEYHLYDYQFFFRNLQQNVADRVAAYYAQ